MGLFGFGNKEKKTKEAINANKSQILMIIQTAQMSCRNGDAASLLRNIQTELQSQGETSDARVLPIDGEILQLLTEANGYMLKNQYPTAITKLNKALSKAIDRHQYCFSGGQMTKEDRKRAEQAKRMMDQISANAQKSRAEELQDQINEKNAELEALQQEFENLRQLNAQNPTNAAIMAQGASVQARITATKRHIDNLTIELNKETADTLVADLAKTNEELVSNRTFTDSEMEVNRAKLQAQNAEMQNTQAQASASLDLLGQGASPFANPFGAADVAAAANPFAASNPFAQSTGAASANPFAAPATGAAQANYGGFNASAVGTADMAREIAKATRALQDSIDAYQDKIDDANDELRDYNAELKPLLERRKNASPSDCLVLDGQIDQVNAKRSGVIYRIKRYRQAAAQLNDKMSLLDKLSAQQDLSATNQRIEQLTNGQFSDFAGLAMFLNDSVKQSNEQLEEIGTAVSVAESEEIFMNSGSGASAALSDASVTKDEDKYAALEQELGMMAR